MFNPCTVEALGPHLGLGAADRARPNRASLIEPGEDFADASVGDEQLSGDVTGSNSQEGELDNPPSHTVGQRTSVHEDAPQLVHARLACKQTNNFINPPSI